MRSNWTLAAAIAGGVAAMLAPAGSAMAESAQDTINRLQSEGYVVTIDKLGTAPVSECTVTSVRNPQQTTQLVPWVGPGLGRNSNSILLPQTSRMRNSSIVRAPAR